MKIHEVAFVYKPDPNDADMMLAMGLAQEALEEKGWLGAKEVVRKIEEAMWDSAAHDRICEIAEKAAKDIKKEFKLMS